MKRKLIHLVAFVLITGAAFSQAPICSGNYFYQAGNAGCIWYHPAETPTTSLGGYFILPSTSQGLAIGPNFAQSGPNPTYWTVISGNYHYYNGTTFVNTGHSAGGTDFTNPGASANFIYNINSTGQVSRYDGSGSATVIATYSAIAGTNGVQDIVGDLNDNYYLLKVSSPQELTVYNPAGNLLCSYSMSNCAYGTGLAINRGKVFVLHGNGVNGLAGELIGNSVVFSSTVSLPCAVQNDLASCANDVLLAPVIQAVPNNTLPCLGGTCTLTSQDQIAQNFYVWTGPGITGSVAVQNITVNQPGVYNRTTINCAGLTEVRSFTVLQSSTAPLTTAQTATAKCSYNPPVTLGVSGLSNYSWSPGNSLSSTSGIQVQASPSITTVYTVSGQLGACTGVTQLTVFASPLANIVASAVAPSICAGGTTTLVAQIYSLTVNWQPGNLSGIPLVVSPLSNTTYTAQVTDILGCSKSETLLVNVFQQPSLSIQMSKQSICTGESIALNFNGASAYTLEPGALNGSSYSVTPISTTIYTLSGANWNCSSSKTITATVNPLPQILLNTSADEVCAGNTVTITANGANTYVWSDGGNGSQTVLTPVATSTIVVTGLSTEGCSNTAQILQKVNACTALKEYEALHQLQIVPNPGYGLFKLQASNVDDTFGLQVRNQLGQVVFSQAEVRTNTEIEMGDLLPGIYFVDLTSASGQLVVVRYVRD